MCNKPVQELEETDPWLLLKKNPSWNIEPRRNSKDLCVIPSLELQLKKIVHSTSQQRVISKKRANVPHHKNKALANLHVEVKKLLEMPLLQPQEPIHYTTDCAKENLIKKHKNKNNLKKEEDTLMPETSLQSFSSSSQFRNVDKQVDCNSTNMETNKHATTQIKDVLKSAVEMLPLKNQRVIDDNVATATRIPSISSAKSSCEALKVGFMALRRVSDHTVLVKWNIPRVLDKVIGYELLVDGRAVKKIFTPTKSMAVVTCLPHTDRVLLTIRTITSDVSLTGHYPATTTIYKPRVK